MTKKEFAERFSEELELACKEAESVLEQKLSRNIEVLLNSRGYSDQVVDLETAVDVLYLGPERFYRIIDVGVVVFGKDRTRVFVRASGHTPGSLEDTRDHPSGRGPFKTLIPIPDKVVRWG